MAKNKAAANEVETGAVATLEATNNAPTIETPKPEATAEQLKWAQVVERIKSVVGNWPTMPLESRLTWWRSLFALIGNCPVDAGMSSTESGKRRPRLYSTAESRKLCRVFAKLYSGIPTMTDVCSMLNEFAANESIDYRKTGVAGLAYAKADSRSESAYRSLPFIFTVPVKLSSAVTVTVEPGQLSEIDLSDL